MSATPRAVERARAEHRQAVEAYVASARALAEGSWSVPVREGAWSPAEVTQHVLLVYQNVRSELSGGASMAPRVSRGWQRLLRWVLLPHILFHRSFPLRARAPRETRPGPGLADRETLLAELGAAAGAFEQAAAAAALRGGPPVDHPYFGPIAPLRALRFVGIHTEHHRRQIAVR